MSTPDEIRADIERTRAELSDNVNALGDSAKPSNVVREQVDNVKDGARNLKERIFGRPDDPWDDGAVGGLKDGVDDVRDKAAGLVHDAGEAVSDAPQRIKQGTRGNPLAAGLVALGIGALIGGLLPASKVEKDAARQVKDAAEPVVEQVKDLAAEAKDHLQPLAQQAADSLKETAQRAGEAIKGDAQVAKDEVTEQAQWSAESVKADAQQAVADTKQEVDEVRRDQ